MNLIGPPYYYPYNEVWHILKQRTNANCHSPNCHCALNIINILIYYTKKYTIMGGTCIVPNCNNTNNKHKNTLQMELEKIQKITFHE